MGRLRPAGCPEQSRHSGDVRRVHKPVRRVRRNIGACGRGRHRTPEIPGQHRDVGRIHEGVVIDIRRPGISAARNKQIRANIALDCIAESITVVVQVAGVTLPVAVCVGRCRAGQPVDPGVSVAWNIRSTNSSPFGNSANEPILKSVSTSCTGVLVSAGFTAQIMPEQ